MQARDLFKPTTGCWVTHYTSLPLTAPEINSHYLSDFFKDLNVHFATNITNKDCQVNYISQYSTSSIWELIGCLPKLNCDCMLTGKTWDAAKQVLKDFYGNINKPHSLLLAEFQGWVQAAADKPVFVSKDQVAKNDLCFSPIDHEVGIA